jgi:hypothetical protein
MLIEATSSGGVAMCVQLEPDDNSPPTQPASRWDLRIAAELPPVELQPLQPGFDMGSHAAAGLLQGALAGCTSLLANVIGSVVWPTASGAVQHPLHLIQVYLTFPLGAKALALEGGALLGLGALLYLATGMLYGMLFVLLLSYFLPQAKLPARLIACSLLALAVWIVNLYGVLAWLQPALVGGRWIVELVPWWVAAATHLLFGWTIAVIYPLGTQPRADERSTSAA